MTATHKIHEGHNVKRIREILGIKQDALAYDLNLSQQAISQLEQKESIDPALLEEISKALKVPVEAIKNFNEDAAINYITNNFNDTASNNTSVVNQYQFNPIEKIAQLYEERIALYERILKEKNELIEKLFNEKNKQ